MHHQRETFQYNAAIAGEQRQSAVVGQQQFFDQVQVRGQYNSAFSPTAGRPSDSRFLFHPTSPAKIRQSVGSAGPFHLNTAKDASRRQPTAGWHGNGSPSKREPQFGPHRVSDSSMADCSLDQQYIQQVVQLIKMLNESPQTKVYANQVQVFLANHSHYLVAKDQWTLLKSRNRQLQINPPVPNICNSRIIQGYQRMQEYLQSAMIKRLDGSVTLEQLDMQLYLVISLLQSLQQQLEQDFGQRPSQKDQSVLSITNSNFFNNVGPSNRGSMEDQIRQETLQMIQPFQCSMGRQKQISQPISGRNLFENIDMDPPEIELTTERQRVQSSRGDK